MLYFILYFIAALTIFVFSWYIALLLSEEFFDLQDIGGGSGARIIASLLIPFFGIFLSGYLFRKAIRKTWDISLGKTLCAFFVFLFVGLSIATAASLTLRTAVSPFRISGNSMSPTFSDGQYIVINKLGVGHKKGDIIIFKPNTPNEKTYYIKRIIATSGDTVGFDHGWVFLKKAGEEQFIKIEEKYLPDTIRGKTTLSENSQETEFTVPEGEYFVLWDNRTASADSRTCFMSCDLPQASHFVKETDIMGKVME